MDACLAGPEYSYRKFHEGRPSTGVDPAAFGIGELEAVAVIRSYVVMRHLLMFSRPLEGLLLSPLRELFKASRHLGQQLSRTAKFGIIERLQCFGM